MAGPETLDLTLSVQCPTGDAPFQTANVEVRLWFHGNTVFSEE